jgi:DNA topoisomerase-1
MGQTEAGLTRHYLDFFWGINLTRALTLAIKNSAEKGFAILSTGRVQGPTLSMLYEKELEIRKFKPKPFWELQMLVKIGGKEIPATYEEERMWKESEAASVLKGSKGKDAVVKDVKKREYKQSPPVPFNTTDLQSECYAQFKYSPTQTLSIAESLYQKGYISYPRSSSQKLPANINYVKIISALAKIKVYQSFAKDLLVKDKLMPNEGKKDDPAHPAVYPTFETPDVKFMTSQQKKVYDIIVRRFLSVFADPATRESNTVSLDVGGNTFFVVGKRTIEPGWTEFYSPYMSTEELLLPEMSVGDKLKVSKLESMKKETQPPGRFSQGSILKEMESRNLGTKATRAEILKTLYDRNYIVGQSIKVTKLGESVIQALKEYAPRILSEELTKKFEDETDAVMEGKMKREKVIEDAKETLTEVLEDFRKHEKEIGKKLGEALVESREDARRLGPCIVCKVGELKVLRSRFSGKFFVGCSSYFRCEKCKFTRTACKCKCGLCSGVKGKCKCAWKDKVWLPSCQTGYPLPGMAKIVPLGKACEKCRTPMIQVVRRGKRPFRMCVDPKCETKAEWGKKKTKTKPKAKATKKVSSA